MPAPAPASSPLDVLDAVFVATAVKANGLPAPMLPEIAFAGRSNVGKSSLINTLVQRRKLVRTSATPGATRGLNLFRATLRGGAQLDLVDLPGYGYAKVSKTERGSWGPLIEGFLTRRTGLRAVVVIVDARRGLEPDDAQLLDFLAHHALPTFVVATKLDKLPANKQKPAVASIAREAGVRAFGFSSEDGTGREALWRVLTRTAGVGAAEEGAVSEGPANGSDAAPAANGSDAAAQRAADDADRASETAGAGAVTASRGGDSGTTSPTAPTGRGSAGRPGAARPATKPSRRGGPGR
jgi:GTP-binding protein